MSPATASVLALSLLLISEAVQSEEMMDPFALIRETLKYWRKIYKMYHEEVILGYCWADYYFLALEDSNATARALQEPRNLVGDPSKKRDSDRRASISEVLDTWPGPKFTKRDLEHLSYFRRDSWKPMCHGADSSVDCYRSREFSRVQHNSTGPSSSSLSSSKVSGEKRQAIYDERLSSRQDSKNVRTLSDPKFEGNGAEGYWELGGKPEDLEVDMHRKLFCRKMSQGNFARRMFSPQVSRRGQQKSLFKLEQGRFWKFFSGQRRFGRFAARNFLVKSNIENSSMATIKEDTPYIRDSSSFVHSLAKKPRNKELIQHPQGVSSLRRVRHRRFMGDYEGSTSETSRNSRLIVTRASVSKDQGRRSSNTVLGKHGLFGIRSAFMAFLRTLSLFFHTGRQIMDYVESNKALVCTKDYLWIKFTQWLDT